MADNQNYFTYTDNTSDDNDKIMENLHKQIIIDGINVINCGGYYFSPTGYHSCQDIQQINSLGYEQDTLCEQNPNCLYKQLKREQTKSNKYKQLLTEIHVLTNDFYKNGVIHNEPQAIVINNNVCINTLQQIIEKTRQVLQD